jgi:hypothetical protein
VDCRNGFCCPHGDRCQGVVIRDDFTQTSKITQFCCIEQPICRRCDSVPLTESDSRTTTAVTNARHGSQCGKTRKVRPFDVVQVAAGSRGAPGSFDLENHDYSIAFALGKKGSEQIVLKVPVIQDDSNATSLSVMVPPYLLNNAAQGKAELFLLEDGVMSDACLGKVKIAKLPKSASKVRGLVTASWLRANQGLYTAAKPILENPAAAPFVNPDILADVDNAVTGVGGLLPSFTSIPKGSPLTQTAKHSDSLLTGMLTSAQKVADPAFASASKAWVGALKAAKDPNDPALKAAEDTFVNVVTNANGPTAQHVGKYITACGAVTTAGMASSAVVISRGRVLPPKIDAQATSVVICGSTITACGVITGTAAVAAGVTIRPGQTNYGKALLKGTMQVGASTRTNHGGLNLATAKVCGCPQPGLIDIVIIIIKACDRIRIGAPIYCLPDGPPHGGTTTTTTTHPGPTTTTTLQCTPGCPGEKVSHKCPWTPEGFSITPCCPGYCWDGGGRGSLSCDQEKPGAPGEEVYGNATVPHSHRNYTTDLVCDDGYVAERAPCTGLLLRCVPAQ